MYWSKKIIEWSPTYRTLSIPWSKFSYALDGRDPNTYANILWCFGRHEHPWPERPVSGTIQ